VRGLGGTAAITPATVEVWMSSWENDRGHIESGHGFGAPVDCAWSRPSRRWSEHRARGPHGSPFLLEGSTCPSGEAEMRRGGSSAFDDAMWLRRDREMSPETPIVPEASLQGSGEIELVVCVLSG
jgi:hypothetical protein